MVGVVLGNVGFHLTHNVGTHVGGLRVDATAHTGKEGLRGGSHAEGEHGGGDGDEAAGVEAVQYEEPQGDVQQAESDHGQPHDSTGAEGDAQSAVQTLAGGVGRAGRGVGGCLHAEETCQTGEEASGEEGEGNPAVLHVQTVGHEGKQQGEHDEDDGYDAVLLTQIGHGTATHMTGDFSHSGRALVLPHHLTEEDVRHAQCHDRGQGHEPKGNRNVLHGFVF